MSEQHMPTRAYFELAANEKAALEQERTTLLKIQQDANANWTERTRAAARLDEIARLLRMDELARRQGQRTGEREVQHSAQQQGQGGVEPVHSIVTAPGFKAITENADGTGAILIVEEPK